MHRIQKLKEKWILENAKVAIPADAEALSFFQDYNNVILPSDFQEYFNVINGTGYEYTDELYDFYPIERIKRVSDEFIGWNGVPNYQAIVGFREIKDLFVFANYFCNLFAYAIKLLPDDLDENEVYVICGEEYKKISNTFSEFLDLYLDDSMELWL